MNRDKIKKSHVFYFDEPKISIVIPNYNRGDMLSETLESVLKQNYSNWEAIVIDDGSTDNSINIGIKYSSGDSRIIFLQRNREPRGAPVCRNIGTEKSHGDYIIFLDSDDLMAEYCLRQRVDSIKKDPDKDFWVFPMLVFSGEPSEAKNVWNIETAQSDISRFLSLDAVWQTSGPIWKKSALNRIGGFTENLVCWQDVDIHLKALGNNLKYSKYYSLQPDIYYRQHKEGSISQGEISSLPKLKTRLKILKNHFSAILNKDDEILQGFKIMASSIAIGSARTFHKNITSEALNFGKKSHLLDFMFIIKTRLIQLLVILRLNRIKSVNKAILNLINEYQNDSNIGKHPLLLIENEKIS
jgi:glycosyltransferase involved in cell wall biosynthesis